ncbi:hypothetical protein GN956_G13352 [Arapaima gigas]
MGCVFRTRGVTPSCAVPAVPCTQVPSLCHIYRSDRPVTVSSEKVCVCLYVAISEAQSEILSKAEKSMTGYNGRKDSDVGGGGVVRVVLPRVSVLEKTACLLSLSLFSVQTPPV